MGRNPAKNQQTKERRREEILSAALALFSSKGLAATKASDIARRAGASHGLLYHYFPSKDDVYVAVVRTAFALLNDACRSLESAPLPAREKIRSALAVLLGKLETEPDAARYHVLIAQANLSDAIPDEARQIITSESALPYQVFERIMAAGQRDGSVRPGDPAQLATAFWTTIKGLALHKSVHGARATLPDASLFEPLFLT